MANHNCIQHLRMTLMAHIYTLESKLAACENEIERFKEQRNQTPITDQVNNSEIRLRIGSIQITEVTLIVHALCCTSPNPYSYQNCNSYPIQYPKAYPNPNPYPNQYPNANLYCDLKFCRNIVRLPYL